MVFDDEVSTNPLIREGTILPNCTDIGQRRSYSVPPDNIDLRDTWFNPYLEEDPIKNPIHEPIFVPYNNNKTLTSSQSEPHVHEDLTNERASNSGIHKRPFPEGF